MLNGVCDKLIHRHPHIYGDVTAEDEQTVKANWEKIKLKEKGNSSVLGGVPTSLPAVVKAMRIQEKARGVGFDWDLKEQVWEKVEEELNELLGLQNKLMQVTDAHVLQEVIMLIEETGKFVIGSETFNFDLCTLPPPTLKRIQTCLQAV